MEEGKESKIKITEVIQSLKEFSEVIKGTPYIAGIIAALYIIFYFLQINYLPIIDFQTLLFIAIFVFLTSLVFTITLEILFIIQPWFLSEYVLKNYNLPCSWKKDKCACIKHLFIIGDFSVFVLLFVFTKKLPRPIEQSILFFIPPLITAFIIYVSQQKTCQKVPPTDLQKDINNKFPWGFAFLSQLFLIFPMVVSILIPAINPSVRNTRENLYFLIFILFLLHGSITHLMLTKKINAPNYLAAKITFLILLSIFFMFFINFYPLSLFKLGQVDITVTLDDSYWKTITSNFSTCDNFSDNLKNNVDNFKILKGKLLIRTPTEVVLSLKCKTKDNQKNNSSEIILPIPINKISNLYYTK